MVIILQSVDNALRIMELLDKKNSELGVSEISKILGLGKSTVHRLLTTLESRGFVTQNPDNNKYKLGIKIVHLGAGVLSQINIIKDCRPHIVELSRITGETVHLAIYDQDDITFIDKVTGNKISIMGSTIGLKKPAYCTATGKSLLAHLPETELKQYLDHVVLEQITPHTITDAEELSKQLLLAKSNGYAEDQQESEEGLVCFSAPIRNFTGKVIVAISISGAASRMNENKSKLITQVQEAAENISKVFGWRSNRG